MMRKRSENTLDAAPAVAGNGLIDRPLCSDAALLSLERSAPALAPR
jgi:hypothetical protein